MTSASYKFVFDRKKSLNSDGEGLVQLEVYFNRTRRYLGTAIHCKPSEWDEENKRVKKNTNAVQMNIRMDRLINPIRKWETKLIANGESFTWDKFDHYLNGNQADSFLEFMEHETDARNDLDIKSVYQHKNTLKSIREFGRIDSYSSLTYANIQAYDYWLRAEEYHQNTIFKHHKNIKVYINRAIRKGLMDPGNHPYLQFKAKRIASDREALTTEEVLRIEQAEIPETNVRLQKIRDMFLFSCYTGIRFEDMVNLDKKNLLDTPDGKKVRFKMGKVDRIIELPIDILFAGKPGQIVRNTTTPLRQRLFLKISNNQMNIDLKDLATAAKISKNLTFHMSRHTFGSELARITADPYLIMDLMGHKDIRTSMIYIHSSSGATTKKVMMAKW